MGFVWISALKDLRRRLADRAALVLWLGIPLLLGGLMSLAMGGGGGDVKPKAKLLVADLDDSFASQALVRLAGGAGEQGLLEASEVELAEGEARMSDGEASGLLVVPAGFGQALFESAPTELRLVTNPSQRILPGILRSGFELLVELVFYVQRVFGDELAVWADGPPEGASFFGDAAVAAQSVAINDKLERLESVLFPPVLKLESEFVVEEDAGPPEGGMGLLLFPGIVFMALLFVAQGMSDDLWTELEAGTLRRALASPQGLGTLLLGKLVASTLVIAAVCALSLVMGALAFGLAPGALAVGFFWLVLTGAALVPLFLFVQTFGSSKRSAGILANVLVFPLMMIGGSFFPFEVMPDWMASLGRRTPNGLAVVRFKELLVGSADLAALANDGALLAAMAAALFFLTLRRTRRRFLAA
ncbi:MAG: ABC transporter permease [Planctomycetes bacterium]|nr:ABC transporter permease [Planctomycetota bacterium]